VPKSDSIVQGNCVTFKDKGVNLNVNVYFFIMIKKEVPMRYVLARQVSWIIIIIIIINIIVTQSNLERLGDFLGRIQFS